MSKLTRIVKYTTYLVLKEKNADLAVILRDKIADHYQAKEELKQTDQLLNNRPRSAQLADIMSKWMNEHQDKKEGWKICECDLCKESKAWLDQIGDPVLHTASGWVVAKDQFKTRDILSEIKDHVIKIAPGTFETHAEDAQSDR